MKRLALLLCLLPSLALAAPFLVCDAPPSGETVDTYQIAEGTSTVTTPAPLHYDLAGVTSGAHSITVKACNVWGCSAATPFAYSKSAPGGVGGLRLSGN